MLYVRALAANLNPVFKSQIEVNFRKAGVRAIFFHRENSTLRFLPGVVESSDYYHYSTIPVSTHTLKELLKEL
jgi:hypothetical protein